MPQSPVIVEVTRGGIVESTHRGRACIACADGRVLAQWGDIDAPVFPRSAIKALQAIPLVETGAFDAFQLTDAELALACASHHAESRHTRLVEAWLRRIGCSAKDLECGAHLPLDEETAHELIRQGEPATALHNNCSGKHAGMLTTARFARETTAGYTRFDHPVQQRILSVLEEMSGVDLSAAPWGVDGCGVPTIGMPLAALARAMAAMARPTGLPDSRAKAVERIRQAWGSHPQLIGGRNSFDTAMIKAGMGSVLVKGGAEGVSCAVLPREGIGIALKIDDGGGRARDIAMAALIRSTRVMSGELASRAARLAIQPLSNRTGREVGVIRPAEGWPEL
jgi:L-asparaginase II